MAMSCKFSGSLGAKEVLTSEVWHKEQLLWISTASVANVQRLEGKDDESKRPLFSGIRVNNGFVGFQQE